MYNGNGYPSLVVIALLVIVLFVIGFGVDSCIHKIADTLNPYIAREFIPR